jgi:hypothetical protein
MNTYLITANSRPSFDLIKFHNFISTQLYPKYISGWWHYLSGPLYIVNTVLNVNQLNQLVAQHMQGLQYIVIKVDPSDSQGWLPKEGWTWLGRS